MSNDEQMYVENDAECQLTTKRRLGESDAGRSVAARLIEDAAASAAAGRRPATTKICGDVKDAKMPTTRASASGAAPSKGKAKVPAASSNVRKKEFRCNFAHCLLTYGGFAPDEMTLEYLRDFVLGKGDAQRWRVGQETYSQPSDPNRPIHFHVAVRYKGKINTKKTAVVTADDEFDESGAPIYRGMTTSPFDITTKEGRVVHANIKTHDPKKRKKSLSEAAAETLSERTMFLYPAKGEQPKEEWEQQHENGPNYGQDASFIEGGDVLTFLKEALEATKKKETRAATFAAVRDAPTVAEGMEILWQREPEQAMKYGSIIERSLRQRKGGYDEKKYELGDFERPPLDLRLPVVLPGRSGMGKTQFLKAHAKYPLVIKTLDGLKKIVPGTTDLLIFDDMNFGPGTKEQPGLNLTADQVIALLSIDDRVTLKTRPNFKGDDVEIPAGLKRVFSTNIDIEGMYFDQDEQVVDVNGWPMHIFPRGANREQTEGISRRYRLETYVENPLYDRKKMRCRKRIVSLVNMLLEKKAAEGSAWHALQPDGFVS